MADRTRAQILADVRKIAIPFAIAPGSEVGDAIPTDAAGAPVDLTMTYENAMMRLMLIQIELLISIRDNI